jgi:uncharacterized protein RhaS with RHS repeats
MKTNLGIILLGTAALSLSINTSANAVYAPHLGRWMQRDPIAYEGGQRNLYEYVASQPGGNVDPNGLQIGTPSGGLTPFPVTLDRKCPCGEMAECAVTVGVRDCLTGNTCRSEANRAMEESGLPGNPDGPADAYHHCYWSCCMIVKGIPEEDVKQIGENHEKCAWDNLASGQTRGRECMDNYNNAWGRRAGEETKYLRRDCAYLCMGHLRIGDLQTSPGCRPHLPIRREL